MLRLAREQPAPYLDWKQPRVVTIKRFHGSVELDPTRMGRDAGRIADEVLSHLTGIVGAKAKITLEIDVEVPNGISARTKYVL